MGKALHSFEELSDKQFVRPAGGTKSTQLATGHTSNTQLGQTQSQSVSRPEQPVGELDRQAGMLKELHEAIERAKEMHTEVLNRIKTARVELESTRKKVEQERGNLLSEQRVQLEASLQELARMEAEIRPRSEALDAKSEELSQRESAVAGLEKEKAELRFLEEILTRRRQALVNMSAAVTKREEGVSQREQSIREAPAELQKQGEVLDARERALDIRELELRQKKESLKDLQVTLDNKNNEIAVLQKRVAEVAQIRAAVTKREEAVSQREQSISDEAAELRKQGARVDARERALDIRERELRQKRELLDALEATRHKKWMQAKAEVARFERRADGLHDEIARLQTRMAELRKAKEPPQRLTGPPKNMPPAEPLPFELLPPGSWDIEDVLKHYRKMARQMPAEFRGKRPDWQRIREIQKLKPVKCYVGKKMWEGYTVYTFKRTTNVVLECPFEGNAIYILDKNWEREVRHTKQYVRLHYDYDKIVHKGEWLDRVRHSLRHL